MTMAPAVPAHPSITPPFIHPPLENTAPMKHLPVTVSPPSSLDLTTFYAQHHRLPRISDHPPPWHYRGWLLAYVMLIHEHNPAVPDRWGYHLRTLEAGRPAR